jgi:lipopolysaccharide/colanic/teichoic acid biosynthesis glycosyltransferase
VRVRAAITVADNFILGSLSDDRLKPAFSRACARAMAFLLIMLLSPLMLFTALFCKLSKKRVVRLPAPGEEWNTYNLLSFCAHGAGESCQGGFHQFFRHFLPGLINIAKGDLRFVGVAPRAPEEIEPLPHHWKTLYLGSKSGLVTEAFVYHGANPTEDNVFSAEAFYGAMASRKHDLKLFAGYFGRLLGLNRRAAELPRVSEEE